MTELEFLTCELQGLSVEDLFRLLIMTDGNGNFWLNTNQYQQRADIVPITTGGTAVLFSTPMPDATYILTYRCYNAANENLEVLITNKTANGFTATSSIDNGTLEYFVTEQI